MSSSLMIKKLSINNKDVITKYIFNTFNLKEIDLILLTFRQLLRTLLNILKYLNNTTQTYTVNNLSSTEGSLPEVQSTVGRQHCLPLGVEASSNYLSLKSRATPGDRGEESETINGSRGEVNREGATPSGMTTSTGPQVETSSGLPVADLREAEGEVNRRAVCKTISGVRPHVEHSSYIINWMSELNLIVRLLMKLDKVVGLSATRRKIEHMRRIYAYKLYHMSKKCIKGYNEWSCILYIYLLLCSKTCQFYLQWDHASRFTLKLIYNQLKLM